MVLEAGPGVYNLLNKTRISCGKISKTFRENVEAYSKTVNENLFIWKYK
jgi:hypothetical protein